MTLAPLGVLIPTGKETLRPGDVLAVAGGPAAVTAARTLLLDGPAQLVSPGDPP